jgi:alpha-beta hydrolase superfamily lysophospholipase
MNQNNMKTIQEHIKSKHDNLDLSLLICTPDKGAAENVTPKAIVQFSHGMCEHKERYIPFMEYLCDNGYACIIHDHRGHGASVKSKEHLGFFYSGGWKALVEDIQTVNTFAHGMFPDIPLFLFGHSMGSMAVRSFTKRYDDKIDGLIVCGSPSKNNGAAIGRMLAKLFSLFKGPQYRPKFIQKIGFDSFNGKFKHEGQNAWICSDSEVVRAYNANSLCNYQFTANGFDNLFGLMQDCYSGKGWITSNKTLPILFVSGKDDPCRTNDKDFGKAVQAVKNAGYTNVASVSYEGMRHEILNETGKEKVWQDIKDTLDSWLYALRMR